MPIDVRAAKRKTPTYHLPSPSVLPPLVTPLSSVSEALPLTCFLTLSIKYWLLSPSILPAGKYSQTTYQPGVSADCQSIVLMTELMRQCLRFSPAQLVLPQPTDVVLLQTSCVKCPVASLKPGLFQSYCSRSRPQPSTLALALAYPAARFSPVGPL
jgi:hypothetical protein